MENIRAGTSKQPPTPRLTRSNSKKSKELCVDCEKPLEEHPGKVYRCVVCNVPQHEVCHMLFSVVDEHDNFYCEKHIPKDDLENQEKLPSEKGNEEENESEIEESIEIDDSEDEKSSDEEQERECEVDKNVNDKNAPPKVKEKLCKKCHNPVKESEIEPPVKCKNCKSAFHNGCAQYNNEGLVCSFCEELEKMQFSNTSCAENHRKKFVRNSTMNRSEEHTSELQSRN